MDYLKEVESKIEARDLESLKAFVAKHTAKINTLNTMNEYALQGLGLPMDSAGLTFVPKSVLNRQNQKIIFPARYDFIIIFYHHIDSYSY